MKKFKKKLTTEITSKQINVIYAKAKAGDLKIERWFMGKLYDLAEYQGYDRDRIVDFYEAKVKLILEAVFEGKFAIAQKLIDEVQEAVFFALTTKERELCNRSLVSSGRTRP